METPESKPTSSEKPYVDYREGSPRVDRTLYGFSWSYIIDYEKSPTLQRVYESIKTKAAVAKNEHEIVDVVFAAVAELYTTQAIPEVNEFKNRKKKETEGRMSLEHYAAAHTGNCSQMTTTAQLMFEKLKDAGMVAGELVMKSAHWDNEFTAGGHVWGVYTAADGKHTVLDIARDYYGDEDGHQAILEQVKEETLNNF